MREHSGPDRRRSGPRKCNLFAIHVEQLCPKATGCRPVADPQSSPTSAPIAHPPARITLVGNPAVAFAAASPNSSLESLWIRRCGITPPVAPVAYIRLGTGTQVVPTHRRRVPIPAFEGTSEIARIIITEDIGDIIIG